MLEESIIRLSQKFFSIFLFFFFSYLQISLVSLEFLFLSFGLWRWIGFSLLECMLMELSYLFKIVLFVIHLINDVRRKFDFVYEKLS